MFRFDYRAALLATAVALLVPWTVPAAILWTDLGATLVHESGPGADILGGALRRTDSDTNVLYFKFHIDPLSDVSTEEYFAAFQLFEGDTERLGVGNSMKAWAYSAFNAASTVNFNKVFGEVDLRSSRPESSSPGVFLPYELPRHGIENTVVFKIQYIAGGDDVITVWLNPDLTSGATESGQAESLTTTFTANASFDQIRLRHGGGGGGWTFSDMAIATAFEDFTGSARLYPGTERASDGVGAALTFRSWQREQGLPQNSVHALAQTPDGYLWIGSDDGITRFDGVRFVSFGLREGWRNGRVQSLFADSRGILWIGTDGGGLVRWLDNQFTPFTAREGLPSDSITALAEDREKRLWVGTATGLALWQNGSLSNLSAAPDFKGKPITTLLQDQHGVMWVGAAGAGVFRFVNGKFVRLTEPSVENLLVDPHCLLEDRSGRIWLGAGDDFVLCREGESWRRYRLSRHLARPYVVALAEDSDGTVWAGSVSEGLFQFRAGKLTAINASSGLSDNFVDSLLADREGNLWVGTAAGLNRLRRGNLAVLAQNEGLGYGPVHGLAEISPGVVWACKPNDGLYRFQGGAFSKLFPSDPGRPAPELNAALVSRDGACWVGGPRGLAHYPNASEPSAAEPSAALPDRNILSLAESPDGTLSAGTKEGEVWEKRNGDWSVQKDLTQTHPVTSLVQARDGSFWLGTEGNGLHHFSNAKHERLDKHNGLLSDIIRTLYLDPKGDLWVGSAGGGLNRFRAGRIATFTASEGLPDNTVSQILEDDFGRLWLGTDRGLACVSKSELDDLAAGKIPAVYPQLYGRHEGMASEECAGGFFPAGLKTRSGHLWFPTTKGIVVADPRPQHKDVPPPTVVLEEVLIDGALAKLDFAARPISAGQTPPAVSATAFAATIQIPPGKRRLEFRYTGLSLRAPERIRFRYRLEGLDSEWVDAGTRRTAFYGFVPPGDYSFHVTACNTDGIWNDVAANVGVTVKRYFWQGRWFLGLVVLGLVAVVAGAARIIEKRKHQRTLQRLEQERALERERARIAQDLHDDLGSSLTRLSLLSDLLKADKDNPAQVETHATKITQSAGQTVRALEEIVWALRPGSDTLQSLVDYISHFANELFEGDGTRCRLAFPHELPSRPLPPEMRHNIFLILKEALTNALKHARAGEVRVQADISASSIEFVVQDNGQGFDTAARSGKGHGLGNMERRAQAMSATLRIESNLGTGTVVKLGVPFPHR